MDFFLKIIWCAKTSNLHRYKCCMRLDDTTFFPIKSHGQRAEEAFFIERIYGQFRIQKL